MEFVPLELRASLAEYEQQADALLAAFRAGDAGALQLFRSRHPRFLRDDVRWLSRNIPEAEIRAAALDEADARLAIARCYDFADWGRLAELVADIARGGPVAIFESAVDAVIDGDAVLLSAMLRDHPGLAGARSTRVTQFDPPRHRATLLHYIAANGVENYRQRTPANAVEIASLLLRAGAKVDALADLYGGACTTMALLVSSCHPARAGLQVALVDTLLDFGASVDPSGAGDWTSPLMTALAFGYHDAAQALVRRGARVGLAAAAGLGRVDDVRRLLPSSGADDRHRALALAAQLGHPAIVGLLLDAGVDPDRFNPRGNHAHGTALHHAALGGHHEVVRLLVERGARCDIRDTIYNATPLGWARYAGQAAVADYLRSRGAPE
jgi:ankyrin repeat protein